MDTLVDTLISGAFCNESLRLPGLQMPMRPLVSDNMTLITGWRGSLQGDFRMYQVMIVAKISTGTHLAVTSQLAQCDTKEQADALCEGVEKQNKESRGLPGFSAATIKLYRT